MMDKVINFLKSFLGRIISFSRSKIIALAAIAILVIAVALGTWYFWPGRQSGPDNNPFKDFSKLLIDSVYAKDNFELAASASDSLGVENNARYILKSRQPLDARLIKEHLEIKPKLDYDFKEISQTEWQIIPKKPVEPDTVLKIALATSFVDESGQQQERDYSWAFQVKDSFKVLHSVPRDVGTQVPADTGIEITFSHDNFKDFEKYFSINPAIQGKFEKHGRTMVFVPKDPLQLGTLYTVTVKKGLPVDGSDQALAEDYSFTFETQPKNSRSDSGWFMIYQKIYEAASNRAPLIQVSANNLPNNEVQVGVYAFSSWQDYMGSLAKRDKLPWWSYSIDNYREDTGKLKEISLFKQTVKQQDNVQYVELPAPLGKGFYLLELSSGEIKDQAWLQVSDLSAYLNITKTDSLVWVNDLVSKAPVAGAEVELLDTGYKFPTDERGLAVFKTPDELKKSGQSGANSKRYYLKINKDGGTLIMAATQISQSYVWYNPDPADDYWQYIYTDRPRYQSTDTVKYWGLVQRRDKEKITDKITATLYKEGYVDYYYRPVKIMEQDIQASSAGVFSGEMKISDLRPDYYTLEIKIGDTVIKRKYIEIRQYTKPAYELKLIPDRKAAFAGENINLKVQAAFFEGTPVPNLDLVFKMPEGEYKFKTDKDGQADLTYTNKYTDCQDDYGCWPKYAYLSIAPQNAELAEITADANVVFYGPAVSLASKVSYPQKGVAEIAMETKIIDAQSMTQDSGQDSQAQAKPAPAVKVEGEVFKTVYTKQEVGTFYDFIDKKSYKRYTYTSKEEKTDSFSVVTDNLGKYVYHVNVEPETSYRVRLKYFDGRGRYNVYVNYLYYYDGLSIFSYNDNLNSYYHFEFEKENAKYAVGENVRAKFLVNKEPMPAGQNRYLYFQLQNGLQEYTLADNYEYNFPFEERDIPNVNLAGVYFNGLSYVTTQTSYYGYSPTFDSQVRVLKIKAATDKEKYKPGDTVTLNLEVKDKDNQPRQAEVNINLIDEAFYAVADDSATPLETLYSNIGPGSLFENKSHFSLSQQFGGAEKGGCFAAGTMILMADRSTKSIENVRAGDEILTFEDPAAAKLVKATVSKTYKHVVSEYLIINDILKVTPEHLLFSGDRFQEAGKIKIGDWLLDSAGQKVTVKSIRIRHDIIPVYNLLIENEHTYFAQGYYVHNEKGGGPREFFTDAALFKSVQTDEFGRASVTFTLPDNITSWRATTQAISKDLFVGVSTVKIPVSLPVFEEVTIGDEYLKDDKPIARLRAYGTALKENDPVSFSVKSPEMGIDSATLLKAKAFEPAYFSLPALSLGKFNLVYGLKTGQGDDAIKLPLSVIESRLQAQSAMSEKLSLETKITAKDNRPLVIVLSDQGQNQLYEPLMSLAWSWGDRIDRQIAKKEARQILNSVYKEENEEYKFEASAYQVQSGGIALLPYSGEELELSARIAGIGAAGFDKESLAQYLFSKLEDKASSREEISLALYGLAELGEPVLTRIQVWLKRNDLAPKEKLYLAQALFDLGDEETARDLYNAILTKYGEKKEPYIIVRISDNQDQVFGATAQAAVLAASLNASERDGLWTYLLGNQILWGKEKNSETLFDLEKLNYIKHTLPNLKPEAAKVEYELAGQKQTVEITGGNIHSFSLEAQQAPELKFLSVQGQVGISVLRTEPINLNQAAPDSSIGLKREYYVGGQRTDNFKESDTIEVRLYPTLGDKAINGDYQITDILPSGLAPVTRLYQSGSNYDCHYWYPYDSDGRLVKYKINKNWRNDYCGGDYIRYYARVKNRGEYKAEPAIIQSFVNPDYLNFSSAQTINIVQ